MLKVSEILLCIPFKRRFVLFSFICVQECDLSAGALRCQKRVLNPPELELQATMSHLTWVLANRLGPPEQQVLSATEPSFQPPQVKKKIFKVFPFIIK